MTIYLHGFNEQFLNVNRSIQGLWCLMPLSTIFQLYRGGQFYKFDLTIYIMKATIYLYQLIFFQSTKKNGCRKKR